MNKNITSPNPVRRKFMLACAASAALPWEASLAGRGRNIVYPDRSLSLHNVHTGESGTIVYWSEGKYIASSLDEINWFLRDFRTSEVRAIDPRLLNILYVLTKTVESSEPTLVLSGFRSKKTNEMLRKTTEGVAKRSFHMIGKAIDIRMPRQDMAQVQRAALMLNGGGVGYYPDSNFVHIDSGPVRTW